MIKTAVVILNWNGEAMLRQFLPSVISGSNEEGTVVYVADNASTDQSCAVVEKEFPSVRLIRLDRNYGFAEGYNRALAQVEAEYVVLLNSDVEVMGGWLQDMVAYMDTHPEVAACQPKILSYRHRNLFEYAGASGGFMDRVLCGPLKIICRCQWRFHGPLRLSVLSWTSAGDGGRG